MKVWGGRPFVNHHGKSKQMRVIICAKSQKRAVEIAGNLVTLTHMRTYWSLTGNQAELECATREGVWMNAGTSWEPEFIEYLDGKFAE